MGLRERAAQIGRAPHNYLERRGKTSEKLKSLQLIREVDDAVGLPQQMADIMHDLNTHKTPGTPSWSLYRISPATIYTGSRVNGWPDAAEGFVLLRRIARKRVGPARVEERYAYIFVGRTFKCTKMGVSLIPEVNDKSLEKLSVRAGETAQYANSTQTVDSRHKMFDLVAEGSALLLTRYGSVLDKNQITIGTADEIRQHMGDKQWRSQTKDAIGTQIKTIIQGMQQYNAAHRLRSVY